MCSIANVKKQTAPKSLIMQIYVCRYSLAKVVDFKCYKVFHIYYILHIDIVCVKYILAVLSILVKILNFEEKVLLGC